MTILFCNNPFDKKKADPDFQDEFIAAKEIGFAIHLFDFECLTKEKDAILAIRKIKYSETLQKIIYRGWMLKPYQYSLLYNSLLTKNYKLINSYIQYQNCHYLPESYKFIAAYTPETVWVKVENLQINYEQIFKKIAMFGDSPLIIKDFVKSQKHYWDTACFIPSAADKHRVKSVVDTFIKLQNSDLNEGLVFRKFLCLNELAIHSKSKMPLKQEYRLFFLNMQLLGCYNYWEEGEYSYDEQPPLDLFKEIAQNIESNFFTMDIAKTKTGEWIIIELGDGQVAGIPENVNTFEFYGLLRKYTET